MSHEGLKRAGRALGGVLIAVCASAAAQEAAPPAPAEADVGAQIYALKCAGCHSIGGGALNGPDLIGVADRAEEDVRAAVQRMSKSVGPMTPEEVQVLTELLMSEDAAARVQKEQERSILAKTAALEPADAKVGEALFHGRQSFSGGGLSCSACHQAGGRGGSLAVPLEDAFKRLGQASLMSACEQPAFPAMRVVYANRPVNKQESLHLAKYLESVSGTPAEPGVVPIGMAGPAGAVVGLVGVGLAYRRRPGGTVRKRMVQETLAGTRRGRGAEGSNR